MASIRGRRSQSQDTEDKSAKGVRLVKQHSSGALMTKRGSVKSKTSQAWQQITSSLIANKYNNLGSSPPPSMETRAEMLVGSGLPGLTSSSAGGQGNMTPGATSSGTFNFRKGSGSYPNSPQSPIANVFIQEEHPSFVAPSPDSFSGKCYSPRPLSMADYYSNANWKPRRIDRDTVNVPDEIDELTSCHEREDFFHSGLSHEEVKCMFKHHGGLRGLTIVRDSTTLPNRFIISIWDGMKMQNYSVEYQVKNGVGWFVLSNKARLRSLAEMLLYFYKETQSMPLKATMYIPCVPSDVRSELTRKQYVYHDTDTVYM